MKGIRDYKIILLNELYNSSKKHCDAAIMFQLCGNNVVIFLEEAKSLDIKDDIEKLEKSINDLPSELNIPDNTITMPVMHKTRRMKRNIIQIIKSNKIKGQPIIVMGCQERIIDKITL